MVAIKELQQLNEFEWLNSQKLSLRYARCRAYICYAPVA